MTSEKFSIHERCSHSKILYFLRDPAFTYSVSGSPEEYRICFFWETASRPISVFSISLSSMVDTCSCVSLSRLSRISHIFYENGDFCPSPPAVTAQWLFRRRSTGCLDFLFMVDSYDTVSPSISPRVPSSVSPCMYESLCVGGLAGADRM